jgi:hypothetical protein
MWPNDQWVLGGDKLRLGPHHRTCRHSGGENGAGDFFAAKARVSRRVTVDGHLERTKTATLITINVAAPPINTPAGQPDRPRPCAPLSSIRQLFGLISIDCRLSMTARSVSSANQFNIRLSTLGDRSVSDLPV